MEAANAPFMQRIRMVWATTWLIVAGQVLAHYFTILRHEGFSMIIWRFIYGTFIDEVATE